MRRIAIPLLGLAAMMPGLCLAPEASTRITALPRIAAAHAPAEESRAPSSAPCPEYLKRAEAEPLGPGPARLVTIRCLDLPRSEEYELPPVVSPDGQSVALWDSGQVSPLNVLAFDGSSGFRLSNRVAFRDFGSGIQYDRQDALAWRSDGTGLWSVEQQVVRPSGWALGGLTPILIDRGGAVRHFALPEHGAGPLDGLAWVGGEGRAIVQFGTRGERYRPEHADPSPTLAMVDVPRRRILHTITAADAEALRFRAGTYNGFGLFGVSAVRLRDGRLRALLQFERVVDPSHRPVPNSGSEETRFLPATWLVWTEGQRPKPRTPFFEDHSARAELTPDGSRVLAWRALQPDGMILYDCRSCQPPPPPTPVEGAIAALIDADSGRTIWRLQARAAEFWSRFGGPVVSPTGSYALIPLPAVDGRQMIGLVAMADGRIVQRFSLAHRGSYRQSFGFTHGGRQMWIGTRGRLAFYDLAAAGHPWSGRRTQAPADSSVRRQTGTHARTRSRRGAG